jgi:hypothetical protein
MARLAIVAEYPNLSRCPTSSADPITSLYRHSEFKFQVRRLPSNSCSDGISESLRLHLLVNLCRHGLSSSCKGTTSTGGIVFTNDEKLEDDGYNH